MAITVTPSVLTEVRLTSFKSFRNQTLPLGDLTLVVGRNGSGKSNALDGLWVLARLATGEDIRDALDGSRDGPSVRGGAAGCVPFGGETFALGATAVTGEVSVHLDVTIRVGSTVQIVREVLAREEGGVRTTLLTTLAPTEDSSDISAEFNANTPGRNPHIGFRATRLLATQVLSRIPATSVGRATHLAAAQLLAALQGVFVLDPVPNAMRAYVNERDSILRRDASNLSAAIGALIREDPVVRARLVQALDDLNEQDIVGLGVETSRLGDVILTVTERAGRSTPMEVSARSISDGTLRFLAILTALWQAPESSAPPARSSDDAVGQTQMVIEELENGLHASQAATLVRLIRESLASRRIRALATAHSPAVLDALEGSEHGSVVVCQRDADGSSTLTRLVDIDGYVEIAAMSSLGRAAAADRLRGTPRPSVAEAMQFLDELRVKEGSWH